MHTLISIIIPTLDEADGIHKVIDEIPRKELRNAGYDVEVIVVDGGSTNGTDEVAKELEAHVVYELRKGYGSAYKTGFSIAKDDLIQQPFKPLIHDNPKLRHPQPLKSPCKEGKTRILP